jgi:hypothetical protein
MQAPEIKQLQVGDVVGYDSPYKTRADGRPMFTVQLGIVESLTWKYVRIQWIADASDLGQQIDTDGLYYWKLDRSHDNAAILALD